MDRRTFLARLGFGTISAAAAVLTFDVEKLLWLPGERTIFLPDWPHPYGGNIVVTPTWITQEVAMMWKNSISLVTQLTQFDSRWDDKLTSVPVRVTHQRHSADWS